MHLPQPDIELFYKLNPALLFFANQQLKVLPDQFTTSEDLKNSGLEKVGKVRNRLWQNVGLIDEFIKANPFKFSQSELTIVKSWQEHAVKGKFFILKYLKKYAIFLSQDDKGKAYGVKALMSPLEEITGPWLPVMVEAILIPFKEHIIYDGFLNPYSVSFGSGIRFDLNEAFKEAKAKYGIIESLPAIQKSSQASQADQLRMYLKTKASRDYYAEEIDGLIDNQPELELIYHQEMGKINSRVFKRSLRALGIQSAWFAVLNDVIVASGQSKQELEQNIKKVVPSDKQRFIYTFSIK